jgi:hypothetical protein
MFVGHYGVSFAVKRGERCYAVFAAAAGWLERRRA